jgi:TonB family protein
MRFRLATALCVSMFWSLPAAAHDVYLPSDQVTTPKVAKASKPIYTSEAMLRRIKGGSVGSVVVLQVDVRPDGTVGTVALVKSLSPDLDQLATKQVKQWLFTPGEKDGKPVTVRIEVTVPFDFR